VWLKPREEVLNQEFLQTPLSAMVVPMMHHICVEMEAVKHRNPIVQLFQAVLTCYSHTDAGMELVWIMPQVVKLLKPAWLEIVVKMVFAERYAQITMDAH
jgi:hypothetical protein